MLTIYLVQTKSILRNSAATLAIVGLNLFGAVSFERILVYVKIYNSCTTPVADGFISELRAVRKNVRKQ